MDNQFVFVASDGDSIGNKVARASLADDVQGLHEVSSHIEAGNELIKDFAIKHGGQVISSGGDEADIRIPLDAVEDLESLRIDYSYVVGATLSLGVGESLSQASKALDVAKLNGKDQIMQYTPEVEQQWQQINQQTNSSDPAEEEAKKIGEAHMKNEEQKPAEQVQPQEADQDDHSDCPYCAEAKEELGEDDCPYCAEEDEGNDLNDCPYCEEAHSEDEHQHDDSCPHCQELDANKAQEGDPRAAAMDENTSEGSNSPSPSQEDEAQQVAPGDMISAADVSKPEESGASEHKSPEEIMEEFDAVHGEDPSQEDQSQYEKIDDTGIAEAGDGQENNISRPNDFDQKIPEGSEDPNNTDGSKEPNYSQVMQEDLNNNADDIQREKVGDMVRQALQSFKANKMFLEQAQSQAPEFYQANILMLRGMIEMAKLLGFNGPAQQDAQEQSELGQQEAEMMPEQQSAAKSPDPANPFPKHPDNGGSEDNSQDDSKSADAKQSDWSNPFPQHPDHGGDAGKPKAQ